MKAKFPTDRKYLQSEEIHLDGISTNVILRHISFGFLKLKSNLAFSGCLKLDGVMHISEMYGKFIVRYLRILRLEISFVVCLRIHLIIYFALLLS